VNGRITSEDNRIKRAFLMIPEMRGLSIGKGLKIKLDNLWQKEAGRMKSIGKTGINRL
jgi:hypothetical protein